MRFGSKSAKNVVVPLQCLEKKAVSEVGPQNKGLKGVEDGQELDELCIKIVETLRVLVIWKN